MDRGNVNPTQHLSWWLRETTNEKNHNQIGQNRDLNSELYQYESPVWWISIGAFKNFITDRT